MFYGGADVWISQSNKQVGGGGIRINGVKISNVNVKESIYFKKC